jgi:hypothetical protein
MLTSQHSIEPVVRTFAMEHGVRQLEPLLTQPPHHAYKAGNKYIIKAIVTAHPETELESLTHHINLIRKLQGQGADIMELPIDPVIRDSIILLAIPFYPHALPDSPIGYAAFGEALASLHISGKKISHSDMGGLKTVDPLPIIWDSLHYLLACEQDGKPFAIGTTSFPAAALPIFESHLVNAQTAYEKLMRLAESRNGFTALCQDVHPANVRLDGDNSPRIIDLLDNLAKGPPEYDLARPNGHWTHRIKRDPRLLKVFMEAYQNKSAGSYTIDPEMLQLAITVADIYYATSMLKNAIRSHKLGRPSTSEWQITEAVDRIFHLDDPSYPWRSTVK